MESKRKVNGTASAAEDLDDRAAKRRKLPEGEPETPESTTQHGLNFVEQLKRTTDKSGRIIATNFLTLPSRSELPDYYVFTKMPIAIDIIESKLKRGEFPTLTTLESYIKRMVQNAKEYNDPGSEIHADAERIRKALSNFMTKNNPAYKIAGYAAFPTPFPPDTPNRKPLSEDVISDIDAEGDVDLEAVEAMETSTPVVIKRKPGRPPKNPLHPMHTSQLLLRAQRAASAGNMTPGAKLGHTAYAGLTFQMAQDKLVTDMISYKEHPDDEYPKFDPFVNLPPKTLKDYYQVIQNPVSLSKLQKKVRGFHGRDITGVSGFRDWKSLEDAVEPIWLNAWHYNEDGSEISLLAKDLKAFFYKGLAEAKKVVSEPPAPKLKLKMSAPEPVPKITLRMGGKASPTISPVPLPNATGIIGITGSQNSVASQKISVAGPLGNVSTLGQLDRARSMSGPVHSPSPGSGLIKNEENLKLSPVALSASNPSNPNPTPSLQHNTSSSQFNGSSMLPPASAAPAGSGSYHSGAPLHSNAYTPQPAYQPPQTSFESKWRQLGKGLNISRHFRMDLPPSDTMAQQSITINLPSTHYYLQIKPTIAAPLLERQHKLFVTSGTQRLHGMPTIPGQAVDPRQPLFEARLLPGVNRIEVELIAALPKGAPKPANGQDVELEKITVFANLLRT